MLSPRALALFEESTLVVLRRPLGLLHFWVSHHHAQNVRFRHLALRRDLRATYLVRGPPVSKKRECCALTAVPRVHSTLVCVIAPSHARAESHASFQVVRISSDRRRGEEALALRVDPHEAEHWTV